MFGQGLLLGILGLAISPQDAARARLEALIEQANALEHFHVEYAVDGVDWMNRVQVDFRAPSSIAVRVGSPSGRILSIANDTIIRRRTEASGKPSIEYEVDLLDSSGKFPKPTAILREEFWRPFEIPRVFLEWSWEIDPESQRLVFLVGATHWTVSAGSNACVLGWLTQLMESGAGLSLEGDRLVQRGQSSVAFVNARTGFLEELVLEPPGGMMVRVSLVQYETGSIPDARHFDVPDRDTSADDLSEWAQARTCTCIRLRKAAMDHVQRVLLRGNPLTRERALDELRRFLVALYDPEILEAWGSWLEDSPRLLGAWTGQLRSLENAGASMYSLALAVALHRGVIAGSLEVFRSRLGERLPADPEEYFDLPAWHEVHDLELSLFQARFDALIKKPILEELDRRVGEALGD